ncbi:plasmid mobilization protein [Vreelandella aquamarina]|uniref:plasmid mobilization protein n=1 Tax=Halomonadaceae TaxID=28256 RepID=UPI001D175E91|nr:MULTISPECIES: conjugal transfer protein TraJ [Halomonas]MCC4289627.1 conjugal transfer protein TraJ [Halomonas axialensis]MCF2913758.1 conjugal transfer protein TraJ [Halomonas sp. Cn5-12]|tara:strand:+ start:1225 stop:1569 length:345 start_codon:yes stop_codon:yes gene_type:complete
MGNETRKRTTHIMVRVSPDEKEAIAQAAAKCDLKVPTYLRELGLGYAPKSTVDAQAFEQLAKLYGDLGRMGGLLKMWLSDGSRSAYGNHLGVPELVNRIGELQQEIREVAKGMY